VNQNVYDELNRLIMTTDPEGAPTGYVYDLRDRPVRIIRADASELGYEYDAGGNLTAQSDADGYRTEYEYDALNRELRQILPTTAEIVKTYDENGNLTSITDANGNTVSYAYDALNRLISRTDALAKSQTYEYDAAGNLTRTTDRLGRVIDYAYDVRNRRISETWDDGHEFSFTYDPNSNMLSASDAVSSVTYTYDALNRVLSESNVGTPSVPEYAVTYAYGCLNVTSVADSLGAVTARQYDATNRLTQLAQTGTAVDKTISVAYDANGRIVSVDRNDAALPVSALQYDALGRLTNLAHGAMAAFGFGFDNRGNITQAADAEGAHAYTYDQISQLLSADHPDGLGQPDESYAYDLVHNRTSSHLHGGNYQTGPANHLLSDGTFDYAYDDSGNLTSQTETATGDELHFAYDHRNRLASAERIVGGATMMTAAYTYDALDRRIAKAVDGTSTFFGYDGPHAIVEFDDSGALAARYLVRPGFDQWLAEERGGQVRWFLPDHQGTIRDLLDAAGAAINHYVYDSFGQVLVETDPGVVNALVNLRRTTCRPESGRAGRSGMKITAEA